MTEKDKYNAKNINFELKAGTGWGVFLREVKNGFRVIQIGYGSNG